MNEFNLGDGKYRYVVSSHKGYAEVVLKNGLIIEAYYGNKPEYRANVTHKKQIALMKMANISLKVFVEMFEHLNHKEECYQDAEELLIAMRKVQEEEIAKQNALLAKINALIQNKKDQ